MPISILQTINKDDVLNTGRIKINSNFSNITTFINDLESSLGALTPEDIGDLLQNGEINPAYLGNVISTAADVDVVDAAGNYSATNVESVLAEVYTLIQAASSASGTSWFTGSSAPSSALGELGDFYLQTDGTFYEKTGASAWSARGNLQGPQGPAGTDGDDGATGPQGPAGEGVPLGGTTDQVLAKASGTDYDTSWVLPDTVTVIFDTAWPSTRPNAVHVLAVGGSTAPTWLTVEDVWMEAV